MSSTENEDGDLVFVIPDNIVNELGLTERTEYEIEILDGGFIVNPKR